MSFLNRGVLLFFIVIFSNFASFAQEGESQLGGWYAYLYSINFNESQFGILGDFQHRNYEVANDFQQWIARAAIYYKFKDIPLRVTLGYGYFNSGTFGESNSTSYENRIHQDILISQKLGKRFNLGHRIRLEQRFVENQDFRTKYRYMISGRVPFNKPALTQNAWYGVAWSEIFINGEKNIGDGRQVSLFDRNWSLIGLGYAFTNTLKLELGYMRETTNSISKGQLLLAINHNL